MVTVKLATDVSGSVQPDLLARAWALGLDVALVEVYRALRAVGVRSILLKGPAIAHWLYDDASERVYTDIDLLISQDSLQAAGAALGGLGFVDPYAGVRAAATAENNHQVWCRGHPRVARVELHHRFAGVNADPALMWKAMAGRSVPLRVADHEIETLDHVGLALIVALHAAAHGQEAGRTREDLARALQRASAETWTLAADLARHLDAELSFALGLRRLPPGAVLAERLDLTTEISTHAALLSGGVRSSGAWGFHQLAGARGWRARAALVADKLLPSRVFMGEWAPWTRRGRTALLFGYGWRLLWVIGVAPRGVHRYRTARAVANPAATVQRRRPAQDLVVVLWTIRCVRLARRQLTATGLNGLMLPAPPVAGRDGGVTVALKALRVSCLVDAAVRQAWLAARADLRDLVVGVTSSAQGFRAHAWLDGDPESEREGFIELHREPPSLRGARGSRSEEGG